jgi:GntR family transcriptional repressor for pyruvate dehydrogenase complex
VTTADFRPIGRSAVTEEATKRILGMIQSGRLQPGDRLPTERELAASLGVSRNSLREAIRALVLMNIVHSRQGDGTYVSSLKPELLVKPINFILSIDPESIFDLFEIRRILESGAAHLAAERISEPELCELHKCLEDLKAHVDKPKRFLEADVSFHGTIIRAARNSLLTSLMESIKSLALDSRKRTVEITKVRRHTVLDHEAIYEALRRRDGEGARAAMIAHLTNVESSLRASQLPVSQRAGGTRDGSRRMPKSVATGQ